LLVFSNDSCPSWNYNSGWQSNPFAGTLADTGTNTAEFERSSEWQYYLQARQWNFTAVSKNKGVWSQPFNIGPGDGFYLNSPITTNVVQTLKPSVNRILLIESTTRK